MTRVLCTGIEIELGLNGNYEHISDLNRQEYHENEYYENDCFFGVPARVEYDSSIEINVSKQSDGFEGCEIISPILAGKRDFRNWLNAIKNYLSNNNAYDFKDVCYVNSTMGTHIHMSNSKLGNHYKKAPVQVYHKARNYFFKSIRNSSISSKRNILRNYDRYFARPITEDNIMYNEKYTEFNLYSDCNNKGMEWRSLNMNAIKTWSDWDECWGIVWDSVNYFDKLCHKYCFREIMTFDNAYELNIPKNERQHKDVLMYVSECIHTPIIYELSDVSNVDTHVHRPLHRRNRRTVRVPVVCGGAQNSSEDILIEMRGGE